MKRQQKREFNEVSPEEAAALGSLQVSSFKSWLKATLRPGDLVHGFLMCSSCRSPLHEFGRFVDSADCDFCAVSADGHELVLTTIAYINGERVLDNPYLKWSRINEYAYLKWMTLAGCCCELKPVRKSHS